MKHQLSSKKAVKLQLETIFDTSSDGIWVCDAQGIIVALNRASERLNDVKAEEVIGKHVSFMEKESIVDRNLTPDILRKKKQISIMQYNQRTGRYLLLTGKPAFDDDNNLLLVVVNERDITQLKQTQEELKESQQQFLKAKIELASLELKSLQGMNIVAQNKRMAQVYKIALKLAHSDNSNILILGESGTGKSLMSKFIHKNSNRSDNPFIQINCAALPEGILEAELFGYERGAFTGARDEGKAGLFELAHEGTLFLDEIGDMPLVIQSKLLTYLDNFEIRRLGSTKPKKIKCQLIAATNQNLKNLINEKKFRQDLFYRLNTFTLEIPPLRKRQEDIWELTQVFLSKYNQKYKKKKVIKEKGLRILQNHSFPGNVRELDNIIKEAVVISDNQALDGFLSERILRSYFEVQKTSFPVESLFNFQKKIDNYEKKLLLKAARKCRTKSELAQSLGLTQPTAFRKLKKHNISLKRGERSNQYKIETGV
ncbi:sigma-54 interaction domain-containing protein [Desulfobacula sp.]